MRIAWVLGWAVPEAWFAPMTRAAFPGAVHAFFPSTRETVMRLERAGAFDWVVGYSLGAHVLLAAADGVSRLGEVKLLSPIFAFAAEECLGGRVSRTRVRHLARWMRRDSVTARGDFYARAGLDVPVEAEPEAGIADLAWGLKCLTDDRVDPPLPQGWAAWCGAADELLDARRLQALDPRIAVVEGASHHPAALIQALANTG